MELLQFDQKIIKACGFKLGNFEIDSSCCVTKDCIGKYQLFLHQIRWPHREPLVIQSRALSVRVHTLILGQPYS